MTQPESPKAADNRAFTRRKFLARTAALSGIVAAFLAQGADPFEAAVAGAYVNGAAGDFAKAEKGYHMVATDLLDWIPKILDDPMCHLKVKEETIEP